MSSVNDARNRETVAVVRRRMEHQVVLLASASESSISAWYAASEEGNARYQ